MSQALHIFKKDVRHLRFDIAIAITVTTLFAFIETKHALWPVDAVNSSTPASYLALLLLPVAWWMLIGRAVHDEALPGDRQFWITRPYSWRSLLGAKILFILAFINLPMLFAQLVILRAYGFSIGAELPGLLWNQILLTIVFILPIVAMSALTTGFVQLIAGVLTPCVVALALASINFRPQVFFLAFPGRFFGGFFNGHDWVKSYLIFLIIIVAGSAIVLWQYSRRGTTVARCFAAAAWILVAMVFYLISWGAAFRIGSALSRTQIDLSSARLVSDLGAKAPHIAFRQGEDYVGVRLPLQIMGLPAGTTAKIENLEEIIEAPDGTAWKSDGFSWQNPEGPDHQFSVQTGFYGGIYLQRNDVPVKVHGTMYLTVFGNPHSTQISFGDRAVPVPQVGLCSATQNFTNRRFWVTCNSPFRPPTVLVSYRFVQTGVENSNNKNPQPIRPLMSFSPFPADLRISPVSTDFSSSWVVVPWDHALVETLEPLGHLRMDFEVTDIRLGPRPAAAAHTTLEPAGAVTEDLNRKSNPK